MATTVAGLVSALGVTASAVRHVGWWLDWHSRGRPSGACRDLEEALPAGTAGEPEQHVS